MGRQPTDHTSLHLCKVTRHLSESSRALDEVSRNVGCCSSRLGSSRGVHHIALSMWTGTLTVQPASYRTLNSHTGSAAAALVNHTTGQATLKMWYQHNQVSNLFSTVYYWREYPLVARPCREFIAGVVLSGTHNACHDHARQGFDSLCSGSSKSLFNVKKLLLQKLQPESMPKSGKFLSTG